MPEKGMRHISKVVEVIVSHVLKGQVFASSVASPERISRAKVGGNTDIDTLNKVDHNAHPVA